MVSSGLSAVHAVSIDFGFCLPLHYSLSLPLPYTLSFVFLLVYEEGSSSSSLLEIHALTMKVVVIGMITFLAEVNIVDFHTLEIDFFVVMTIEEILGCEIEVTYFQLV